jgi:hypothetical protein
VTSTVKPTALPGELAYIAPTDAAPAVPVVVNPSTSTEPTSAPVSDAPPQLAAEILIPPPHSADGAKRFIYVSNRNEPSALGDSLSIFSASPSFSLVSRVHTGVKHLRGLAFSPDGEYLAVVGQFAGGAKVLQRKAGGVLDIVEGAAVEVDDKSSVIWL